jgi:hypothetical protein
VLGNKCAGQHNLKTVHFKEALASGHFLGWSSAIRVRIISNAGYKDHTGPLFKRHEILPLEQLIKFSNLKFMHCYVNHRLPFSFNETWITNRVRNPELRLRNVDDFYVPAHRLETVKRFPYFSFPKMWNEEPPRKLNPNKKLFCSATKSALLATIIV